MIVYGATKRNDKINPTLLQLLGRGPGEGNHQDPVNRQFTLQQQPQEEQTDGAGLPVPVPALALASMRTSPLGYVWL